MIILIGSQKGGSGKSTISFNISGLLATKGKDVVLVDADRQSTAANWVSYREERENVPKVHCIQKYEVINQTLADLNERYEYVIVDCAGRDSKELRTAMGVADIMIIPFRPSQADLDTIPTIVEVMDQMKIVNPDMKTYGLITMAPTNPMINETKEAKEYLTDYPEIKLLKTLIRDRKVYRDALSEGLSVVEMGNAKAKAEFQLMVDEVLEWQ